MAALRANVRADVGEVRDVGSVRLDEGEELYVVVTEPLSDSTAAELSPRGRVFFDSKRLLNYFRLTPSGRLLFGGRNDLSTGLDLEQSAVRLKARVDEVFPQLAQVPVTHSWTGQLGITFDLLPHVGRSGGVHYALGYCGHGVAAASYLGAEVGQLLCGERSTSLFAQIPHPSPFYARYERFFLPVVAAWYRRQDRAR